MLKNLILGGILIGLIGLLACTPVEAPAPVAATETPAVQPQPASPTPTPLPPSPEPTDMPVSPPEASPTPPPPSGPSPTSTPDSPSAPVVSNCTNKAGFFGDVTIPDDTRFKQGEKFVKTWRIRNEGTCAWGPEYSLVYVGGAIMNGVPSRPMPEVQPGQVTDLSIDLTAPQQGGMHIGYYKFRDPQGNTFGVNSEGIDYFWVRIQVDWTLPGGTASTSPTPAPSGGTGGPAGCTFADNADYTSQVLTLINQARATQGLPAFTQNAQLSAAARTHSLDMGCNDFIDHVGSDGSRWGDRIAAQGYAASYTSENIYVGNPQFGGNPDGAMTWWMNSDIHRRNILTTKATEIGIGYVFVEGSSYGGYYTVVFARP